MENIFEKLEDVVKRNTKFYSDDFLIDQKLIKQWMRDPETAGKPILWLSRRCGTQCMLEEEVFVANTYAHDCWCIWGEETEQKVIAYKIFPETMENDQVFGKLEKINYLQHIKLVRSQSKPAEISVNI